MPPGYSDPFQLKKAPSFDTTAVAILADAEAVTKHTTALCHRLVHIDLDDATFSNVIQPIAEDENSRSEKENHLRFYASTHPVKELRDASYAAAEMFSNAEAEFFSQTKLFALVHRVWQQFQAARSLGPSGTDESFHYLSKLHEAFIDGGCGITDAARRQEFVAKKKRAIELAKSCRKNLANETTGLWLTRSELRGVPRSFVAQLRHGHDEYAEHVWVPTKNAYSSRVLESATEEATRKKMYYAVMNRMPDNVPLHRELVLLRDETAQLLGWSNHFASKTSRKMVKTEAVHRLLSEVRTALRPVAERAADELRASKVEQALADSDNDSTDEIKLYFWDKAYFEKQADLKRNGTDGHGIPVSEYFELNSTLAKLLQMYVHILGVRLVPVETAASIWHEDVQMFSAWAVDSEPDFLGYAYFDFFPREGKFTHAGQYTLQKRFQKPDGSWFHPCSCLVMNYLKPTPTKPTLLDLNDVRSLFHELGHMYHNLLSRSRYSRLHAVSSDFVETPSMMLEQFFWDPQVIEDVSLHYSYISPTMKEAWLATPRAQRHGKADDAGTGEAPRKISRQRAILLGSNETSRRVRTSLNELFYAMYDMQVHSPASHDELEQTNLAMLYNKLRCEIFCMHGGEDLEGWEYCQGQSVFRAINGKYDAGYYAYILGRLFAINIFEAGFAGDVLSRENGRRYRELVLCMGGTQPEMKTLIDYLGHEPSSAPYLAWLGANQDACP
ncbi:uncharacterized protein MYCGRDRAFT_74077 [Zymoseptoria tritici IPO323]|uniref:Peptidase M3A/M3B catalytic domain-containing protein n=1 Tax=Zymoseptoria tritici (strain CBS 115943 / IPO323) TaxID=336722 RepID=F9XFZ1_ZYMTI|nr:uncharacterized protein MYCGRDRAFT_74077 [Zymoseptoria tritici IPO323]EGP86093.1 hypothetical protein MYCGRDRAFT_74077 [Zymoseptoria tritici IPO323]